MFIDTISFYFIDPLTHKILVTLFVGESKTGFIETRCSTYLDWTRTATDICSCPWIRLKHIPTINIPKILLNDFCLIWANYVDSSIKVHVITAKCSGVFPFKYR